jgi:hypothetical protein
MDFKVNCFENGLMYFGKEKESSFMKNSFTRKDYDVSGFLQNRSLSQINTSIYSPEQTKKSVL